MGPRVLIMSIVKTADVVALIMSTVLYQLLYLCECGVSRNEFGGGLHGTTLSSSTAPLVVSGNSAFPDSFHTDALTPPDLPETFLKGVSSLSFPQKVCAKEPRFASISG